MKHFVWASLAALLVGGPASPDRDVEAALVDAALAHSGVARSDSYATVADADVTLVFPEPGAATALADQAARALSPSPSPSQMPVAIAITFFTAPPISTPATSLL